MKEKPKGLAEKLKDEGDIARRSKVYVDYYSMAAQIALEHFLEVVEGFNKGWTSIEDVKQAMKDSL